MDNLSSGDKVVHLNQKRFNTGVILQGGGIWFLGQRWDSAGWLLQEGCKNHSRLLHISLAQSKTDTGHQTSETSEEAVKMGVVSPWQSLLTHGCHHTAEVEWVPFLKWWNTLAYSSHLAPSDYHVFPNLRKHPKGMKFSTNEDVMYAVDEQPNLQHSIWVVYRSWSSGVRSVLNPEGIN